MIPLTLTRGKYAHAELEISRSRFLGFASRVDDEASARKFFAEIRGQHPTARHHCTAFTITNGVNPIERSCDDGEPAGTAGMPILGALRSSGLIATAVMVVRYFGGVKLGTGGLVRAYTDTTVATLEIATKVRLISVPVWELDIDAADSGRLHAAFEHHGIDVISITYGTVPERPTLGKFTLSYHDEQLFLSLLASLTQGTALPHRTSNLIREEPS